VANRRLEYTITGDARDFNKTLRSIDQRLATSEKNAHGFARGLSSAFGSVGHAAGLAGAAIGAGLVVEATRSIKAFQESNKVARQTQAVLKSTGGAANVTARRSATSRPRCLARPASTMRSSSRAKTCC
jgi:hypothetical protein